MAGAATATELESLVVRLLGDATSYMKMLEESSRSSQKVAEDIKAAGDKIEGISNSVKGFAETAASGLAALGAGAWLKEAFNKFSQADEGIVKLTATLKANGRQVKETMDAYNEFAEEMQALTVHDDDAVLSLLRLAETYDLTGEQAKKAAKDAIALGAATDTEASSMIRLTAALAKGDVERAQQFARMVPQLRGIKDLTEFQNKAEKLIASGMETAAAMAQSASGQLKKLKNEYDNLLETLGAVVARGVLPLLQVMRDMVGIFQNMPNWVNTAIIVTASLTAGLVSLVGIVKLATLVFGGITAAVKTAIGYLKILSGATATTTWAGAIGRWTVLIAAATAAGLGLAKAMIYLSGASKQWQNALTGLSTVLKEVEQRVDTTTGEILDKLKSLDTVERTPFLERQVKIAEDQLKKMEDRLEKTRERLAESGNFGSALFGGILGDPVKDTLTADIQNKLLLIEKVRERLKKLQEEMTPSGLSKEAELAVNEFSKALDLEAFSIGKTRAEIEAYKISLLSLNDSQKKVLDDQRKMLGVLDATTGLRKFTEETKRQTRDLGASPEQIRLDKLIEDGKRNMPKMREPIEGVADFSPEAKAWAKFRLEVNEARKALQEFGKAEEAKRLLEEMNEQIRKWGEEANHVFEETRTPLEKYNAEIFRLGHLVHVGALDWETYKRAVLQAQKALSDTSQTLEAKTYGSAQAIEAVQRHFEPANPAQDPAALLQRTNEVLKTIEGNTEAAAKTLANLFGNVEN